VSQRIDPSPQSEPSSWAKRWFSIISSIVAALVWAQAAGATGTATAAWPMALHDAEHTGTASVSGPTTGHILWTRYLGGNITPGPAVGADGTIYIATNSGVLYALDPSTGATQWTFNGGSAFGGETDLSVTPLILPTGEILWSGPNNTLFALSAGGAQVWTHRFQSAPLSPTLSGDRVYVEQMGGTLSAIDVAAPTPAIVWSIAVGHVSYGSAVVAPDGTIVTTADRHVIGIIDEGAHARIKWEYTTTAPIEVSPAVGADGTVIVSTNDRFAYALSSSGKLKWRSELGSESYSSASVSGGLAYYGDNAGGLHVVAERDGALVFTDRGVKGIWSAQAIDEHGDVYFGTQGRHIYGYNRRGKLLFDLEASGPIDSYPALTAGGALVIGDEAGTLYAIGSQGS
jgi:outer membrane protein assembly factor BamB